MEYEYENHLSGGTVAVMCRNGVMQPRDAKNNRYGYI
jgi:hypothetical protein